MVVRRRQPPETLAFGKRSKSIFGALGPLNQTRTIHVLNFALRVWQNKAKYRAFPVHGCCKISLRAQDFWETGEGVVVPYSQNVQKWLGRGILLCICACLGLHVLLQGIQKACSTLKPNPVYNEL
jgi:hypothetical protein